MYDDRIVAAWSAYWPLGKYQPTNQVQFYLARADRGADPDPGADPGMLDADVVCLCRIYIYWTNLSCSNVNSDYY